MSNDPPQDGKKKGDVFDAIPTEEEGDALFDELFGDDMFGEDVFDDAEVSERETNRPPAPEERVAAPPPPPRPDLPGRPAPPPRPDIPARQGPPPPPRPDVPKRGISPAPPVAAAPPVRDEAPTEPTLGEAVLDYRGATPPDFEDDEPYAEPYELPGVVSPDDAATEMTKPGPPVARRSAPPPPTPAQERFHEADEPALRGLGAPAPSQEEIRLPRPDDDGVVLVEPEEESDLPPPPEPSALALDDVAIDEEDALLEMVESASQPPPDEDDDDTAATVARDVSELMPQVLARAAAVQAAATDEDIAEEVITEEVVVTEEEAAVRVEDGEVSLDADRISIVEEEEELELDLDDVEVAEVSIDGDGVTDVNYVDDGDGLDAVVSLMQQGQRDAWLDRAEWLYQEAPPAEEAVARARALLPVSEMFAMAGEDERAEATAREVLQLAPSLPLAHRQLRGILMARGRWTEVADALENEGRVAPSPAAQLHTHYLGAEVARLAMGDPEMAHRRMDNAERVAGRDLRIPLMRTMQALAATDDVPARLIKEDAIGEALEAARVIRSDGVDGEAGENPYPVLLRSRAALRERDTTTAIAGLRLLGRHEPFKEGAAWLRGAMSAPHEELRHEAIDALAMVSEGSHGAAATRARAARALEAGRADVARELVSAPGDIFTVEERVAVAALSGSFEDVDVWRDHVDDTCRPLLAAAASALGDPMAAIAQQRGDDMTIAQLALGRAMAAEAQAAPDSAAAALGDAVVSDEIAPGLGATLREQAAAMLDIDPDHGAARAVVLEHSHLTGQKGTVIESMVGATPNRERALFGATLAEQLGDTDRIAELLQPVMSSGLSDMATTRLAMSVTDGVTAVRNLVSFAEAEQDPLLGATALTEAGLRLMEEEGHETEGEGLLRQAAERSSAIPIAAFIGLYVAQALEDDEGVRFWLEQRRSSHEEGPDRSAALIRLALRLSEDDEAERVSLVEEAHRARPTDYALRDLYERMAKTAGDRAQWLTALVEQGGPEAASAAVEAAIAAELEGDLELSSTSVQQAIELGDHQLAPLLAERLAELGHGTDDVVANLETLVSTATEPRPRAELQERLAGLALRGLKDEAKAFEALKGAVRDQPEHLVSAWRLITLGARMGRLKELSQVALQLAQRLDGAERTAMALLAARLVQDAGQPWSATDTAIEVAMSASPQHSWALRQAAAHAREKNDHEMTAHTERALADIAPTPQDQATLLLRAAEAQLTAGEEEGAAELLRAALDLWPRHPVALVHRAAQLERLADASDAAQAWEEVAGVLSSPKEKAAKLYRAAVLWLSLEDGAGQAEGRRLLEEVATIDPNHEDTFERLQAIYLAEGAKRALADLLAARIESVEDSAERVELEVLRGRMLVEAGSAAEARDALSAALEANPDNPDALRAYADICAAEEDWEAVEQSLIRLGRLVSEPEAQVDLHMRLGVLYAEHLPNPERATAAFEEVLRRDAENIEARQRLVAIYLDAGQTEPAFAMQQEVIEAAKSPTEQCMATVRLAEIHEVAGDTKQAEQMLVKARRQWNKEPAPVKTLYAFYQRTGQDRAAEMLLERAAADVRRGFGAGRFEAPLFAMAQMVAEMRGQEDAAEIAAATLAAIRGDRASILGCGLAAAQADDAMVAPDVFSEPFRELLTRTGAVMDRGAPFDVRSMRAQPLKDPQLSERIEELAQPFGLGGLQIFTTSALGPVAVAASSDPPALCLGDALVETRDQDARDFLLLRALKAIQNGTAALTRTAPIDLWPLVGAYLKLHSPSFNPPGVDASKLAGFHNAMLEAGMVSPDPKLGLLASEVIRTIGNRASSLNAAANSWGTRVALLALGDPVLALRAVAWAAGTPEGPPTDGPERLRWISRQAEARDLIVFSVSEGYHESRAQLGPSRMPDAGELASLPAPPPAAVLDDDEFEMADSVEPELLELDLDDPGDDEDMAAPPGPPPGPPGPPPARGGPPGPPPARMPDPPPPDFDDDEDDDEGDFVPLDLDDFD